MKVRKWL